MASSTNPKARILTASAGSGKTYSLAYQYIYNVLRNQPEEKGGGFNPYAYRAILAVTFTNKATEEMKSRILHQIHNLATANKCEFAEDLVKQTGLTIEQLQERAMAVRSAILHDYSRFAILTNDTFFQRIVRAFVKELGIEINYAIELDTAPVVQKSADNLIETMNSNPDLQEWLLGLAEENISQGKQWDIKRAILQLKGELFKEQTKEAIESVKDKAALKKMIFDYLEAAEREMEQIKDVAREALSLIFDNGYSHSTFLRSFTEYFEKIVSFNEQTKAPSKTILDHCSDEPESWFKKSPKPTADMLELAINLQPLLCQVVKGYQELSYLHNSATLLRRNYRSFALLGDLYQQAAEICREQNTMLLSETKHTIASFVTEDDAPFIYEKVGNRFEQFMIDEFQDTSLKEWRNFLPLLRNAISQSADVAVLLVGDIKQSIYRWRGSDWNILKSIAPNDLSKGGTPIIHKSLDCNYRSLPNIVEFNNNCMRKVADNLNSRLNSMLDNAIANQTISEALYKELYDALGKAYEDKNLRQTPKRKHTHKGYIEVAAHYTEEPDIVSCIRELVYTKHYNPCDITILVRDRASAQTVAKTLLDAGSNDPTMRFGIMTQEALKLNSSFVVQFILAIMRYAVDRSDTVSLGLYNRYVHSNNFQHKLSSEELTFFDSLAILSPEQAFELILMQYPDIVKGQAAYTGALHEHIIKFCTTKVADIRLFLSWWADNGTDKSVTIEKENNAIEIMTIHKSKGLENKVVIIPFCTWRFIPEPIRPTTIWASPSNNSMLDSQMLFPVQATTSCRNSIFAEGYYKECVYSYIDAINLLYVALTRAKEQLYIFFPVVHPGKEGYQSHIPATVGEEIFRILKMEEEYRDNEEDRESIIKRFGISEGPEKQSENNEGRVSLTDTPVSKVKLKLKLPSFKYFDKDSKVIASPRDKGIMLHRVMERAVTYQDIENEIKRLVIDGIISTTDSFLLSEQIAKSLNSTIAAKWFDGSYTTVRRESSIIAPGVGTKRPDRVMINGDEAVVVDYKFGEQSASYLKQITEYCQLLKQMGYNKVKGYIWYIREAKIEEIV
ncbi:MAG: UvrD-helicase domain-containing protein [Alistipes sp.]|nr:UvrD-helicase domain-containing protein [Alistipes sp.]